MATATTTTRVDWSVIWAQRGFRYFSVAMFVSLFGSGLNFTAVSWYILSATHSTIAVSMQVIVVTLPGLFVPFVGGVLIDRYRPPLPRRAARSQPRYRSPYHRLHRVARPSRPLAPVRDDAHHRHGLCHVLVHGQRVGAGSDSAESVHRRERRRPDRRAKRHADGRCVRRLHLRLGRHRRNPRHRRRNLLCLGFLPIQDAPRLRFAARTSALFTRIFRCHRSHRARAGIRRKSRSRRSGPLSRGLRRSQRRLRVPEASNRRFSRSASPTPP